MHARDRSPGLGGGVLRRASLVAVTGWLALAVSCAVDSERDRDEYRKVLDATVKPPAEPDPDQPLSLEQAMAIANQNNEQLGLSGEDYVQALIAKNRAVAAFLPTVSFQPSYEIADKPTGFSPAVGSVAGGFVSNGGGTVHKLEAPVVGDMNLFRGFGDVAGLHSADAIIAQRRELLLDMQATVLLNVAQTYYQVLRSERAVEVLQGSLRLQEARLSDIEQWRRNGLATALAVAQTRAQVDATRVTLLNAQNDVKNGRHVLALVMGVPSVEQPLADSLVVPDDPGPETQFEEHAIDTRQDLKAAQDAMEAARHGIDAAVAQYYPSISLNVSGFLYRENFSDASKWDAILSANLPIFSAGLIEADVRTAWSRLRQAALYESWIRREVVRDVRVAHGNLLTSQLRVVELQDEVAASDEAYRQSQDSFRNGLAINLDVLAAQDQLLNAQLELAGAQFDRAVFFLDLRRATGELESRPP